MPGQGYRINASSAEEGYLVDFSHWDHGVATAIAERDGVSLSADHWEVVLFLRDYYAEFGIAPAIRVLTKAIGRKFGPEKGNSKHLYDLFPAGPAKQACRIAGLPKPTGCIWAREGAGRGGRRETLKP